MASGSFSGSMGASSSKPLPNGSLPPAHTHRPAMPPGHLTSQPNKRPAAQHRPAGRPAAANGPGHAMEACAGSSPPTVPTLESVLGPLSFDYRGRSPLAGEGELEERMQYRIK